MSLTLGLAFYIYPSPAAQDNDPQQPGPQQQRRGRDGTGLLVNETIAIFTVNSLNMDADAQVPTRKAE